MKTEGNAVTRTEVVNYRIKDIGGSKNYTRDALSQLD